MPAKLKDFFWVLGLLFFFFKSRVMKLLRGECLKASYSKRRGSSSGVSMGFKCSKKLHCLSVKPLRPTVD